MTARHRPRAPLTPWALRLRTLGGRGSPPRGAWCRQLGDRRDIWRGGAPRCCPGLRVCRDCRRLSAWPPGSGSWRASQPHAGALGRAGHPAGHPAPPRFPTSGGPSPDPGDGLRVVPFPCDARGWACTSVSWVRMESIRQWDPGLSCLWGTVGLRGSLAPPARSPTRVRAFGPGLAPQSAFPGRGLAAEQGASRALRVQMASEGAWPSPHRDLDPEELWPALPETPAGLEGRRAPLG